MKKLVIIGASGFGKEVAWLVERINKVKKTWELIGFLDDNEMLHGKKMNGYPILGECQWAIENQEDVFVVCAIGSAKSRTKIFDKLAGVKYATLVDPSVEISDKTNIGEGSIICAGTIITADITIKSHVIINLDCTVGHDTIIESYVTLYPSVNVSGNVHLEEGVEMGTGSQIIQGIKIGKGTIVGAGAVVVKELPQYCTAVGIPALAIKYNEPY